ncbi:unnamed protein product [Cryptosporidium hominis]|uniref:Uncharacterized protein n=1 Tax=Cryptosporidium hominis TaxID=237895 RepID=A0A0S4TK16_CRYHO|nr:hypothetical protein ChTU502y2012_409g0465 [Cryptosporidium hominis]PPA65425.1 putative integral membrane protein [Cryptosporidium hominis]PPS95372.1 Uncharacterized protein GY17_00002762 [Cryptosporidium hominis]CUV07564.1 unnamed protein product [Cryptosporidium hominis]|eukprot:PPS95372.1 Uncharacterized protein GY17_00002762 [Cryptosporidium hominis]
MEVSEQKQTNSVSDSGVAEFIEAVFGIDQKLILKILNFTCLFLALVSFTMSYIAYQYNEMLHLKLLLSLAVLLVIFSGLIFWYIPKFEEFLNETNKSSDENSDPPSDKKND